MSEKLIIEAGLPLQKLIIKSRGFFCEAYLARKFYTNTRT